MEKEHEISIDNVYKNEFYIMFAYIYSVVKPKNTSNSETDESEELLEDEKCDIILQS